MTRLLNHYWSAADPANVRQAQVEDYLEDLREFGAASVERACHDWRQSQPGKKPAPGFLRSMCIQQRRVQEEVREKTVEKWLAPSRAGHFSELEAEGAIIADKWARDHGYRDRQAAYEKGISCFDIIRNLPGLKEMPRLEPNRWNPIASELAEMGIKATERVYTSEEMAKARAELGIKDPIIVPRGDNR